MKKLISVVSVAIMGAFLAFALTGCGSSDDKVYQIATDTTFAPFEFQNADGEYEGIDVAILAAIAEDQGFEYELNPLGFDAALQAVQSDQADGVIAGMSITDERKQTFDFSEAYFDSTVCAAVAEGSDVASLDDLKGAKVAVKTGTMSADWANSMADQYGWTVTSFETSDIMYQDVSAGNSAACFEDTPVMGYAISTGQVKLKIVAEAEADSDYATPYGFAVKKGENAELLEMFNAGLQNIKDNGKYDEIVAQYIAK